MRITQTFVLRLLIDPTEPGMLRGTLHSVADDATFSFADEPALLALLRQMASEAVTSMQRGHTAEKDKQGG